MAYPNLPENTGPLQTQDCDCIVSLPVQSTTSMRFNMTITEGNNLILKNVGNVNAIYVSDSLAEESVSVAPGQTYAVSSAVMALCVKTDSPVMANLLVNGQGIAFNVTNMLFIDEVLDSFEISTPSTATKDANVALFYVLK